MRPVFGLLLALSLSAQTAREILESNCGTCHGAAQMGGLDMRTREGMLKGGKRGAAVTPGKPDDSLLIKAVLRQGELQMPPGKTALTAPAVAALRQWVSEGAQWDARAGKTEPSWWAFRKPVRTPVPPGEASPIDAFIASTYKDKGLHSVASATRHTLVRRAYFDLHGLPPTSAQVDEFVGDSSPDAWAKLIDKLLESPRYGERWGRHWLDVVRYADTAGFETDVHIRNAWR